MVPVGRLGNHLIIILEYILVLRNAARVVTNLIDKLIAALQELLKQLMHKPQGRMFLCPNSSLLTVHRLSITLVAMEGYLLKHSSTLSTTVASTRKNLILILGLMATVSFQQTMWG